MKYFTYALLLSSTAFAQNFTGIPVLKGSLKTKILVKGTQTTCKIKVVKVRNLMEEDSFGNPGYRVRIEADLDGRDSERRPVVKFDREFTLTNFWQQNGQVIVKDLEYGSNDGANLTIKPDGRIKAFSFPFENEKVTCSF